MAAARFRSGLSGLGKQGMTAIVFLCVFTLSATLLAEAQEQSPEHVIRAQIGALTLGDSARAYGFASESIKRVFPDAEVFMAMVEAQYGALIDPRSLQFPDLQTLSSGVVIQSVNVLDRRGENWQAVYRLGRSDRQWRIEGVSLVRGRQQVI